MLEITGSGFVITSFINVPGCVARKADSKGVVFFRYVILFSWFNSNINCLSVGAVLSQVIIVSMTLFKLIMGRRVGWTRTPLTSLMLRQGLATFFIVLGTEMSHVGPFSSLIRNAMLQPFWRS